MEMPKLDNHTACEMVDITQLIPQPKKLKHAPARTIGSTCQGVAISRMAIADMR